MLMPAAATRMGGVTDHSSSISPSWHPSVLAPNHHRPFVYDHNLATASPSPATPAATVAASPPRHSHNHLVRPASRRGAGKPRRPRPSRKLPTTYISADAASFRRMVHQVTGADDVVLVRQATAELLCRPGPAPPSRASLTTTTTTMILPTLDTSAFLLGAARGAGSGRTPPLALALARPGSSGCHGSAVAVGHPDPGAALKAEMVEEACGVGGGGGVRGGGGGEYNSSNGSAGAGGFPSSESWDDDALF